MNFDSPSFFVRIKWSNFVKVFGKKCGLSDYLCSMKLWFGNPSTSLKTIFPFFFFFLKSNRTFLFLAIHYWEHKTPSPSLKHTPKVTSSQSCLMFFKNSFQVTPLMPLSHLDLVVSGIICENEKCWEKLKLQTEPKKESIIRKYLLI